MCLSVACTATVTVTGIFDDKTRNTEKCVIVNAAF